jgi:hypothetical protein
MEFVVNKNGHHPLLSQCVFIPVGRGAAIDQDTFWSFIRIQNECLHNIRHVEIHGLADSDMDRHVGDDIDDGEDISNSIREILLNATANNGLRLFHSVKRAMKSDNSSYIHQT